jgi:hypothetical protein
MIERGEAWGGIVALPAAGLFPIVAEFVPGPESRHLDRRHFWFGNPTFNIIKLRVLASRYHGIKRVFVGDQKNSLMRHFANLSACEEVIALDDGSATLKYARERIAGEEYLPVKWQKRAGHFLKSLFFGLRDAKLKRLTFFSVYPVALPASDRLELNEFRYLRKQLAAQEITPEVYFLGGPLVEAGVLSEDEYLWHLLKVKARLGDQALVYVSHRREDPERVSRICHRLGWQVKLFDFPIEYQLAMLGSRPMQLASFYSSALENCRLIFNDLLPIVSFRLDPTRLACRNTPKGAGIFMVYEHFERNQTPAFQVINL